ncbi:MAG TPA: hypothetical protein VJQ25_10400, partial [Nitrospira sp.]|nr:hypothetical protein [Nitrospira sp.]
VSGNASSHRDILGPHHFSPGGWSDTSDKGNDCGNDHNARMRKCPELTQLDEFFGYWDAFG